MFEDGVEADESAGLSDVAVPKRVDVFLAVSPRLKRLFDGGGPAGVKEAAGALPKENPLFVAVGVAAPEPVEGAPKTFDDCVVVLCVFSSDFLPNPPKPPPPAPPPKRPPPAELFCPTAPNGLFDEDVFPKSDGPVEGLLPKRPVELPVPALPDGAPNNDLGASPFVLLLPDPAFEPKSGLSDILKRGAAVNRRECDEATGCWVFYAGLSSDHLPRARTPW